MTVAMETLIEDDQSLVDSIESADEEVGISFSDLIKFFFKI